MTKFFYTITFPLAVVFISGCSTVPLFMGRSSLADAIAGKAGFTKEYIKAGDFTLMTYQRFDKHSDTLSIYIEGDGRAWESKYELSQDPTPLNPVALRLAAVDPKDNVAYIARPGQYSPSGAVDCDPRYWSGQRFAPEVVGAIDKVIDVLKEKSGAKYVELMGYSGGGAIAVLVAARRSDVRALRTVAGNLNTYAFCAYHHVSPLDGSMNPLDVAQKIARIPQRHFVGSKDSVVPGFIAQSFVEQEGDKDHSRITIVQGATHSKGWPQKWRELLSLPLF